MGVSRGGGGSFHGGGASRSNFQANRPSGGYSAARPASRPSGGYAANRPAGGGAYAANRPAGGYAGGAANRPVNRPGAGGGGEYNRGNGNRINNGSGNRINNGNVNIGNDVNINRDGDWDHGWDWDDNYHPIAAGVAFGTAAAVTSAAIGSMYYSLPPSCSPYAGSYYYCGGTYYEPRYEGDKVVYVVVDQP